MPLAAYCKKCKSEVPVGDTCSQCGGKLTKAAVRFSFRYHHVRWKDWNCWNSLLRIAGPVWLLVCAVVAIIEIMARGWSALGALIVSQTAAALVGVGLAVIVAAGIWMVFAGSEMQYFFLDAKGVNLSTYLEQPKKYQLWMRGLPGHQLAEGEAADPYGVYLGDRQLPWTDVKRVQIWHDKNRILLYAPSWWMQMAVNCPADEFDEAVAYVIAKMGKRKDVKIQHTPDVYAQDSGA